MITNQDILHVALIVKRAGGRALVVGGYIRDQLFGVQSKDIDMEVYGIPAEQLLELLKSNFEVDLVGQAFGIIKLKRINIDVSLPRRESKFGVGHKDFFTQSDHTMTVQEAASRRDFTINSMAEDPLTGEFYDYYGGVLDIRFKVLRHTSEKFSEDALRVLRGMQFISRFNLHAAPETIALCKTMDLSWISGERVLVEWNKMLLQGKAMLKALEFLEQTVWIRYWPELAVLRNCPQDPEWHPEGDVWTHTKHCMQCYADQRDRRLVTTLVNSGMEDLQLDELMLGYAVLLHDTAKATTTTKGEDGRWHAYGHEEASTHTALSFLLRMTNQMDFIRQIQLIIGAHMTPDMLYKSNSSASAIRRLANKVVRIDLLCELVKCDKGGRPPLSGDAPCCEWLINKAAELQVVDQKPKNVVMGRHLLELGVPPGKRMGEILARCFEAQLEGTFTTLESGIEFAKGCL